jgi:hypothetical protein
MRRPGWSTTLRGVLLRLVLQCLVVALLMGLVGLAVGGWLGARNGAVFGLLAGALALPFLLGGLVSARGGGVEDEGHQVFYDRWYGDDFRGRP